MMQKRTPVSLFKAIILAALLVGTLDIGGAVIHYLLQGHNKPANILVYIASGAFGEAAFEPSVYTRMALTGLLFHYGIALAWTGLYFLAYAKTKVFSKNKLMAGICYGILIWLVMNLLVVPLSNAPQGSFNLLQAFAGIGILIIAMGIPVSLMASRYFSR